MLKRLLTRRSTLVAAAGILSATAASQVLFMDEKRTVGVKLERFTAKLKPEPKLFKRAQVAKHNTKDSCWVTYQGG